MAHCNHAWLAESCRFQIRDESGMQIWKLGLGSHRNEFGEGNDRFADEADAWFAVWERIRNRVTCHKGLSHYVIPLCHTGSRWRFRRLIPSNNGCDWGAEFMINQSNVGSVSPPESRVERSKVPALAGA